jgi:hypothetical protein
MKFSIKADLRQVERMATTMQRQVIPKAAARAINRAIDAANTTAAREISSATKIKQKDVRRRLFVRGASAARLAASLEALPMSPNLRYFKARQNKAGVAATAWEQRKTYKGAFQMPSGLVVKRTTKKRYPIKGLRGPSVPKTFMQQRILARIAAVAEQRWRSEFERELARRLLGSSP